MGLRNIGPIVWWILHSLIKAGATGTGVGGLDRKKMTEKIRMRNQEMFLTFKMTFLAIIWTMQKACFIKYLNKR